jgi:hypothetical protein
MGIKPTIRRRAEQFQRLYLKAPAKGLQFSAVLVDDQGHENLCQDYTMLG